MNGLLPMRGYNDTAVLPAMLADAARAALDVVGKAEDDAVKRWLAYSAALNKGRSLFPSDREFGQRVCSSNLDKDIHQASSEPPCRPQPTLTNSRMLVPLGTPVPSAASMPSGGAGAKMPPPSPYAEALADFKDRLAAQRVLLQRSNSC